jgi:hypothetical protein
VQLRRKFGEEREQIICQKDIFVLFEACRSGDDGKGSETSKIRRV